jgi:acyl-CoA dehydrogenase
MYRAQEQLHSFLRNLPNRPTAFLLRCFIFPRGRTYSAPSDDLGRKIVDLVTRPGEARDRLSQQAYTTLGPGNPLGLLQEALELSEQMAPLERKLKQSQKEGLIRSEYLGHQIDEAERAEIISKTEAKNLRSYHQKVLDLLAVDDFAADEIGRAGARSKAAPQKPVAKKAAARKKAAKKKTSSKKKIAKKPSG